MKILIIDEELPYPLNTGKRIRSFYLSRALAKDHEVTYLGYGISGSPAIDFMNANGIIPIVIQPPNRKQSGPLFYLRLLLNLFSSYPYIVTSHFTTRFQNKIRDLLAYNNFDCLICEWTPYAVYLKDINGIRKIIVAHNVESSIWRGYEATERIFVKNIYIKIQKRKIERFEKECFNWADGATAVSREDADIIERFGVRYHVGVIENGVDLAYFMPQHCQAEEDAVVFSASMDWRPNQDAALYFVNEILPIVKKKKPHLKTYLVGRRPPKRIRQLANSDNIAVTGTVEDVRPYIAMAALSIVPLRIGGGSRLKILEAMAMQKTVISTSLGAQGLRVEDGINIVMSDDPEDFANSIFRCLDDIDFRKRIASSGRELAESYYSWEILGSKYNNYVMSVINRQ